MACLWMVVGCVNNGAVSGFNGGFASGSAMHFVYYLDWCMQTTKASKTMKYPPRLLLLNSVVSL